MIACCELCYEKYLIMEGFDNIEKIDKHHQIIHKAPRKVDKKLLQRAIDNYNKWESENYNEAKKLSIENYKPCRCECHVVGLEILH